MSKTLSLGIVIAALGTGAAAAAIGSVNTRVKSIGETMDQVKSRIEKFERGDYRRICDTKKGAVDAREEILKY